MQELEIKIQETNNYIVKEECVYVINDSYLRCIDLFTLKESWSLAIDKVDCSSLFANSNHLFFNGLYGNLYRVDKLAGDLDFFNDSEYYLKKSNLNENILVTRHKENSKYLCKITFTPKLELLWQQAYDFSNQFYCSNNQFYFVSRKGKHSIVKLSDSDKGEIIWGSDLSEVGKHVDRRGREKKGEVKAIIGEYNNILYLWATERKLVALSCKNGEVLWEKTEFDQDITGKENDTKLPYLYNTYLDEKRGIISCLIGETYYEIDLASRTAKCIKNIKEDVPGFQLFAKHTVHEGGLIYFTSQKSPETPAIVLGIFDKQKQKVIWAREVEFKNGAFFIEAPKYNRKYVYCLDSEKSLHIFEKET